LIILLLEESSSTIRALDGSSSNNFSLSLVHPILDLIYGDSKKNEVT